MISIETPSHLVNIAVQGQFTLADFSKLEDVVISKIDLEGRVTLLFDLRDMTGTSLDVAWEEIRFARAHRFDLWKIGVVAESQLVAWGVWLVSLFSPAQSQVFDDYNLAREWVSTS